jgi:hypothetical protein
VAVDYVDFVQAHSVSFLADQDRTVVVTAADTGPVQFTVRCSLGRLNDLTHQQPPPARDGDAGQLGAGTLVYAQKGWPPSCRLIAQTADGWQIYQARTASGALAPCAADPSVAPSSVASTTGPYGECHSKALPSGDTAGPGDFTDFLIHEGNSYSGDYGLGHARESQRGSLVFRVRCSFSAFSDYLFTADPHQGAVSGDDDAAFLPAGAPVYAVKGSSPLCRLMAQENQHWEIFTAQGPGCVTPAPIATALPPRQ